MKYLLMLALGLASVAPQNYVAGSEVAGYQSGAMTWEGRQRTWRLFVPQVAIDNPGEERPLVLVLHGGGGDGDGMRGLTLGRFEFWAAFTDCIVVYPDGWEQGWNDDRDEGGSQAHLLNIDDVGFLEHLCLDLIDRFQVDPQRIWATGMSNGGYMSLRLARQLSHRVSAVAPVAAALPDPSPSWPRAVSTLIINGTEDPLLPFHGGQVGFPGDPRGLVFSTWESAERIAQWCGIVGDPEAIAIPDIDPADGTTSVRHRWPAGTDGARVELVVVTGGGHTWPQGFAYLPEWLIGKISQDFNGVDAIMNFFMSDHRQRRAERRIQITAAEVGLWDLQPLVGSASSPGPSMTFSDLDPGDAHILAPVPAAEQ